MFRDDMFNSQGEKGKSDIETDSEVKSQPLETGVFNYPMSAIDTGRGHPSLGILGPLLHFV